jgi:hypothetical protein
MSDPGVHQDDVLVNASWSGASVPQAGAPLSPMRRRSRPAGGGRRAPWRRARTEAEIQAKQAVGGGASGMGRATAELLAARDPDLAVLDLPGSGGSSGPEP